MHTYEMLNIHLQIKKIATGSGVCNAAQINHIKAPAI